MCELCLERLADFKKELEETTSFNEEQIKKCLEEYKQKLEEIDKEYGDTPLFYRWYEEHWLRPKVKELNPEYYRLSKREYEKLEKIAHEYLMENQLDEIENSMPQWAKQDKERFEQTEMSKMPKSPMQKYLEQHNIQCPQCGSTDIRSFGKFQWACNQCNRRFKKQQPITFK